LKWLLIQTYDKVFTGKHLSDALIIQNGLKQGDALSQFLLNSVSYRIIFYQVGRGKSGETGVE